MSFFLVKYRQLMDKLEWVRWQHSGHESKEEDILLDEMDEVWGHLTEDERVVLGNKRSTKKGQTRSCFVDVDVSLHPGAVRRIR